MTDTYSYVKYTPQSAKKQEEFKEAFERLELLANAHLSPGRAKSLFATHLEIAYMWIGKAIRDEQLSSGTQTAHVPERTNE